MRLLGWVWFGVVQLVSLLFTVVGWVILIPLAASGMWVQKPSPYFPGRTVEVWRGGALTWVWGNWEDGVIGAAFYRARFRNVRVCAYCWSAWRNPANNLRFIFLWRGGPFRRWEFSLFGKALYFQLGWYPNGFPVMSGGGM